MLLIKEGNAEAVVRDLVLSSHFRKLKSSLGTNKAASKLGKLDSSENKLNKLVLSSRQFSPKVALKSSALSFSQNQLKIAFNAIENLKNGDRLKADEVSMLIANGKFSRANIDANNATGLPLTFQQYQIVCTSLGYELLCRL
jgi:hypothetical protein